VFVVAVAALLLFSWSFDSAPALFLAGSILGILAVRALLFLHSAKATATSTYVARTVAPTILRQGSPVNVTCMVHLSLSPGLRADIADLPPPGAPVTKGSTLRRGTWQEATT